MIYRGYIGIIFLYSLLTNNTLISGTSSELGLSEKDLGFSRIEVLGP